MGLTQSCLISSDTPKLQMKAGLFNKERRMVLYYFLKKNGKTPDQEIRKIYRPDEVYGKGYYMAFSQNTSDDIVEKFRTAPEKVRNDGRYQKIQNKYLH